MTIDTDNIDKSMQSGRGALRKQEEDFRPDQEAGLGFRCGQASQMGRRPGAFCAGRFGLNREIRTV
ncbi:MAG: hypothetical protein WDN03_06080 [Rhizomicrobium sp.]